MSNKAKRLDRHETRIGRILRAEEFGVVVAIVGIVIVAMSLTPNFAVGTNINTILQQVDYGTAKLEPESLLTSTLPS